MDRRHSSRLSDAHQGALDVAFQVGQRVRTPEGLIGRVQFVTESFAPGNTAYQVTLDTGMGGGTYLGSQLRPVGEQFQGVPHNWSNLPSGITAALEAEAEVIRTASDDYPEMGRILHDRPDPASLISVIGSRRAITANNEDSGLKRHMTEHHGWFPDQVESAEEGENESQHASDHQEPMAHVHENDPVWGFSPHHPAEDHWEHESDAAGGVREPYRARPRSPREMMDHLREHGVTYSGNKVPGSRFMIDLHDRFHSNDLADQREPHQHEIPDEHQYLASLHTATEIYDVPIDGQGDAPMHGLIPRAGDPQGYDSQSTEGDQDPAQNDDPWMKGKDQPSSAGNPGPDSVGGADAGGAVGAASVGGYGTGGGAAVASLRIAVMDEDDLIMHMTGFHGSSPDDFHSEQAMRAAHHHMHESEGLDEARQYTSRPHTHPEYLTPWEKDHSRPMTWSHYPKPGGPESWGPYQPEADELATPEQHENPAHRGHGPLSSTLSSLHEARVPWTGEERENLHRYDYPTVTDGDFVSSREFTDQQQHRQHAEMEEAAQYAREADEMARTAARGVSPRAFLESVLAARPVKLGDEELDQEDEGDVGSKVYKQLAKNFPPEAIDWVKNTDWSEDDVPLDQVDWKNLHNWTAWREPKKVARKRKKIEKKLEAGKDPKRVVMVNRPGSGDNMIADGHHRGLAYAEMDSPVHSFVAHPEEDQGPWDDMHAQQYSEQETGDPDAADQGKDLAPGEPGSDKGKDEQALQQAGDELHGLNDDPDKAPADGPPAVSYNEPWTQGSTDSKRKKDALMNIGGPDAEVTDEENGQKPPGAENSQEKASKPPKKKAREAALYPFEAAAGSPSFRFHFTAAWRDVVAKAKRIRANGGVRITASVGGIVVGQVSGDHDVYESGLQRWPGRPRSIAHWACGCPWASWHQDKAYPGRLNGRPCSHVWALQLEATARQSSNESRGITRTDPAVTVPYSEVVVKSLGPWTNGGWAQTWTAPATHYPVTSSSTQLPGHNTNTSQSGPVDDHDWDDDLGYYDSDDPDTSWPREAALSGRGLEQHMMTHHLHSRDELSAMDPHDVAGQHLSEHGEEQYVFPHMHHEHLRSFTPVEESGGVQSRQPVPAGEFRPRNPYVGSIPAAEAASILRRAGMKRRDVESLLIMMADQANAPWGSDNTAPHPPQKPYGATEKPQPDMDPGSYGPLAGPDPENWGEINPDSATQSGLRNEGSRHTADATDRMVAPTYISPVPQADAGVKEFHERQDSFPYVDTGNTAGPSTSIEPRDPNGIRFEEALRRALDEVTGVAAGVPQQMKGHEPASEQPHPHDCTCTTCEYNRYHSKHSVPVYHVGAINDEAPQLMGGVMGAELKDEPEGALDDGGLTAGDTPMGGGDAGAGTTAPSPEDTASLGEFGASKREQLRARFGFSPETHSMADAPGQYALDANATGGGPGESMRDEDGLGWDMPSVQTIGSRPGRTEPRLAMPDRAMSNEHQQHTAQEQWSGGGSDSDEVTVPAGQPQGSEQSIVAAFQASAAAKGYAGGGPGAAGNGDIATAARAFLQKTAVVSDAEASELIAEGKGQRARNLDLLDLDGTHYAAEVEAMNRRGLDLDDFDDDLVLI